MLLQEPLEPMPKDRREPPGIDLRLPAGGHEDVGHPPTLVVRAQRAIGEPNRLPGFCDGLLR